MGVASSKLEKALGTDFPDSERYFGLDNFGNTCYVNSVVQSLYHCQTFRKEVLDNQQKQPIDVNNMLTSLAELFQILNSQKKKTGSVAPKKFVDQLRSESELFKSNMHQDAQEFLNFLLNAIVENLQKAANKEESKKTLSEDANKVQNKQGKAKQTWVHDIFEGKMTNETRCICCEHVSSREESFFDLSVDICQNSSLTQCLNNFSSMETLRGNNKFHCDRCNSLQEAQKSIKIKKLPQVMAIQLKRFKYSEEIQNNKKLSYRVAFPFELKMCNTSQDCESDPDTPYELFAVVLHVGSGPNHGHYKTVVKSCGKWLLFDDDLVDLVDEKYVRSLYGFPNDFNGTSDTGYILFYKSISHDKEVQHVEKKNEHYEE
ncbi:UBP4 [Acrasis kona]|uniref:ubiquitinyl hydrolase 1 n=1 Tax=Acrasis kona TaxID=1008807 RepID=A0AAW2YI63_9EUKA